MSIRPLPAVQAEIAVTANRLAQLAFPAASRDAR